MRYIIYGKNLEVTEGLKQAVHDKFSKLEKFFTPETEVQVTLSVQKDNQIVEATIPMKGTILRVEPNSCLLYTSDAADEQRGGELIGADGSTQQTRKK